MKPAAAPTIPGPSSIDLQSGLTVTIGSANDHDHSHGHEHDHDRVHPGHGTIMSTITIATMITITTTGTVMAIRHGHAHSHGTTVRLETEILAKNNRLAERNRGWLAGRNILALNLVSSPGAGKTTLLERTIRDLGHELALSVIEGDQETINDAERIRATGCRVVQINTGTGCHLDAVDARPRACSSSTRR